MIKTNQVFLRFIDQWLLDHPQTHGISSRVFKAQERIIWQGESFGDLFLIIEGIAKCFITEENGRDYVLAFLGKGEIMGEVEIVLGSDNLCNIEAITRVEVFKISVDTFHKLMEESREFNQMILREFAIRLNNTAKKASYQQVFSIENKVLKILYLWPEVSHELTKSDLADYLGIPIRSLNRVLKDLRGRGLIADTGNKLSLLSKALLE